MLEAYTTILGVLATIFGSLMSMGNFVQALKIYQRKSSADVSLLTYVIFFSGVNVWFLYGLSISDSAIIIANLIGIMTTFSVIVMYFKYKK